MRLTRVHVDLELAAGTFKELPAASGAHIARVLRARAGDALVLFNGDGGEYGCLIESVRGTKVVVSVGARREPRVESNLSITLTQSIARGEKMDFIVQKATELGIAHLVPVVSQRSVVKLEAAQARAKQVHWQGVAASACEQCGRVRLPTVHAPQSLLAHLGSLSTDPGGTRRLVFEPDEPAAGDGFGAGEIRQVELAIGPEGGFASDELEAFRLAGFARARLGPRVLRTETAAIAAIVWLQTIIGDLSSPSDHTSRTGDPR
jgi:16S rRNA (uracil1498-N3)-methyltransferase